MTPSSDLLLRPIPPSIDELLASLDLAALPTKAQAHEAIKRDFLTPPSHLSGPGWEDFALFVPFLCSQPLQPTPFNPSTELVICIAFLPPQAASDAVCSEVLILTCLLLRGRQALERPPSDPKVHPRARTADACRELSEERLGRTGRWLGRGAFASLSFERLIGRWSNEAGGSSARPCRLAR